MFRASSVTLPQVPLCNSRKVAFRWPCALQADSQQKLTVCKQNVISPEHPCRSSESLFTRPQRFEHAAVVIFEPPDAVDIIESLRCNMYGPHGRIRGSQHTMTGQEMKSFFRPEFLNRRDPSSWVTSDQKHGLCRRCLHRALSTLKL